MAQTVPASHFFNPGSSPGQAAISSEAGSLESDYILEGSSSEYKWLDGIYADQRGSADVFPTIRN